MREPRVKRAEAAGFAVEDLPLLRGLDDGRRQALLHEAVQHSVAAGTIIFDQGEMPNFQLVVLAGSVQLFSRSSGRNEVLMDVVRASQLVIPAAVATGAPYLMGARTPEASRFLMIQAAAFRAAVAQDPILAQAVIDSLAQQFRRMVRQTKNLKLRSVTERVGCYVLALSQRQGSPDRAILPYEKSLIASELGMTRESLSRALSALGKVGIHVKGQTIFIHDAAKLAAACGPDPLIDGEDAVL